MSKDSELYKRLSDEAKAREAARLAANLAAKDKARNDKEQAFWSAFVCSSCGKQLGASDRGVNTRGSLPMIPAEFLCQACHKVVYPDGSPAYAAVA